MSASNVFASCDTVEILDDFYDYYTSVAYLAGDGMISFEEMQSKCDDLKKQYEARLSELTAA